MPGKARSALLFLALSAPTLVALAIVVGHVFTKQGIGMLVSILRTQQDVALNSLAVAGVVVLVGVPLALGLAWLTVYVVSPWIGFLRMSMFVLLAMPSFAVSGGLLVLVGHNGLWARLLGAPPFELYGPFGLTLANLLTYLPFSYWLLVDAFRGSGRVSEDAARVFGASRGRVFREITLPALRPALVAAGLLLFVEALMDVANPLVLGGSFDVLASRVYAAVAAEFDPTAGAAYAMVLLIPVGVVWLIGANDPPRFEVAAQPARYTFRELRHWGVVGVVGASVLSIGIWLLVAAVLATAVIRIGPGGVEFTLDYFGTALSQPRPLAVSLLVALSTTLIATVAGVALAIMVRLQPAFARPVSAAIRLAQSIPGLVLSLGALLIGWWTQSNISDWSLFAMILVLSVRLAPSAYLTCLHGVGKANSALLDVSRALGVSRGRQVEDIWVPYLRWPVVHSAVSTFSRTIMSINSVILLTSAATPLLSVRVLRALDAGRLGVASATSVLIVLLVGAMAATTSLIGAAFGRQALGGWKQEVQA